MWTAPQGQSPTGPGPGSRDFVVVVSISPVEERSSVAGPSVLVFSFVMLSSPLSLIVVISAGRKEG